MEPLSRRCRGRTFPSRACASLLCALFCVPIGHVAADEPADRLARLVPARGLTLYLEYDGLETHANAWKATAASQILTETPAGVMITDAARRAFDHLQKRLPGDPFSGNDVLALQAHLTRHAFAFASFQDAEQTFSVFIVRGMDRPDGVSLVKLLLALVCDGTEGASSSVQARGRMLNTIHLPKNESGLIGIDLPRALSTWWLEGDTLIAVKEPEPKLGSLLEDRRQVEKGLIDSHPTLVERVLDVIDGKAPNGSTHPMLTAALAEGRDIAGFEPNGLFVTEAAPGSGSLGLPSPSLESVILEALGVAEFQRVILRWGFRGKALLTDLRFEGLGAKRTNGGLFQTAGFRKDRLPPIPRGAGAFVVCVPRRPTEWREQTARFQGTKLDEKSLRLFEWRNVCSRNPKTAARFSH